jgi:hypothetical protein
MIHDIYSLGVIMVEVGLWTSFVEYKSESSGPLVSWKGFEGLIDDRGLRELRRPEHVREALVEAAQKYLPPIMGHRYTEVVMACLSNKIGQQTTGGGVEAEAKMGLAYINTVISTLEKLCI